MADRPGQILRRASGEVLLARARYCASFLCRLRGLMFRRALARGEGLLLVERRESRANTAIHMLFVFFPIAVVWLDAQYRVVDTRLARPWWPVYAPRVPAQYVLEAAPDLLARTAVGDALEFVADA